MTRAGWWGLALAATSAVVWLLVLQHADNASSVLSPSAAAAPAMASPANAIPASTADGTTPGQHSEPEPVPLTPVQVAKLVADAQSADGGTRAKAIDELAAAPEKEALPVLQKAINGGEPIDRQLALSSLHTLALRQGDDGGGIRELLRQVIYDGGDEAVSSGAQAALDDIEYQADTGSVDAAR